jgi:hypothetical protein
VQKLPLEEIQEKTLRLRQTVEDTESRLEALRDAVPIDLGSIPETVVSWQECPSAAFHVHGLLSLALTGLREARELLQESEATTQESVHRRWRRLRES